ncbi:MAG: glycine zipper 2TM domain-containing protein [Proteobacteria bacterium]|nr:glycine zipper 2TM domain-containing protein [Pseudomonadota bacterium]
MRIQKFVVAGIMSSLLLTSACAQHGGDFRSGDGVVNKEQVGTLAGAVGGAWIGSNVGKGKGNIAAIAGGTLLGAYLGNQVGASLDRADMSYYNNTAQTALETGRTGTTSSWKNPDSGNEGTVTPTRTFQSGGRYCREYTQTVNVGGKKAEGYGTACRQPDGTWEIVKQ